MHLLNQTPIDSFTKKQPAVETATYGSEFMAARVATEQIMELRTYLRYLGVELTGGTYMFGDNKTVVDSSNIYCRRTCRCPRSTRRRGNEGRYVVP